MNKLFSKVAALSVGLAMAIGVGVVVGSKGAKAVKAATTDEYVEATLAAGKEVVIVGNNGSYYAMGAAGGTTSAPSAIAVTVSSGKMTSATDLADHIWVVSGSSEGWTFTKKGDTSWLYCTNSNNGVRVGSNTNKTFTISTEGYLLNGGTSRYVGIYNSQDWRCYTSINNNIKDQTFSFWELNSTEKTMGIRNNSYASGPFEVTYGDTAEYKYALAYDVATEESLKEGCSWEVSDESIIDYTVDGWTWLAYKPKTVGTTTITVSCEGYKTVSTTITVIPGSVESLTVSGSMSKTSYYVGESWSPAGLSVEGTFDSGYVGDVTDEVEWSYNPASPALGVESVVATATLDSVSANSSAQAVTVAKTNPLQLIYSLSTGTAVDVYGVFVGNKDGNNVIIMDGAYGMDVYKNGSGTNSYVEGETILHVVGKVAAYHGLIEISDVTTLEVVESADVEAPITYAAAGNETADYASRKTTVTGVPTVTKGSFDSDPGTADITMSFDLGGGKSVQVFYKKASQSADSECFEATKSAVTNSSEITVKGFTAWYDGFQVQMNGYVKPAEDYTAEDFAQELLDLTDAVCENYVADESKFDTIKSQLTAIWTTLQGNDKYPALPADQKTILAEAERDEKGTVVEQAMARYDFLTGKYDLSNFINGRTPVQLRPAVEFDTQDSNTMIIIIAITAVSAISLATLLVLKKKKHN